MKSVERQGLCGNTYCEWGEQHYPQSPANSSFCPSDCTPWQSCPTPPAGAAGRLNEPCGGNGRCIPVTGACECYVGYAGRDCGQCDADHILDKGWCMPLALIATVGERLVRENREAQLASLEEEESRSNSTLLMVRHVLNRPAL